MTNDIVTEATYLEWLLNEPDMRPRGTGNPGLYAKGNYTTPLALVTNPYEPLTILARENTLNLAGKSPLNVHGRKPKSKYTHSCFTIEDILYGEVDTSAEYVEYVSACFPRIKDMREVRRSYVEGIPPEYAIALHSPNQNAGQLV